MILRRLLFLSRLNCAARLLLFWEPDTALFLTVLPASPAEALRELEEAAGRFPLFVRAEERWAD